MKKCLLLISILTLIFFISGCQISSILTTAIFSEDAKVIAQDSTSAAKEVPVETDQRNYTVQSLTEVDDTIALAVHYPLFDNPTMNAYTTKQINTWVEAFRIRNVNHIPQSPEDQVYLTVDFSIEVFNEDLTTVLFDITEKSSDMSRPSHRLFPLYYSLSTTEPIEIHQLFAEDYLTLLSQYCDDYFKNDFDSIPYTHSDHYAQGIAPLPENYSTLILSDQSLAVIFIEGQLFPPENGPQTVSIPPEIFTAFLSLKDRTTGPNPPSMPDKTEEKEDPVDRHPMIALTFDDGPHPDFTLQISEILNTHGGRGTFFVQGNRVERYSDVVRQLVEHGHEIGNHSYNHPQLSILSTEEIQRQINLTDTAIFNVTGLIPTLLRPTYGAVSDVLVASAGKPLVLWSIDTRDWENRNSQAIEIEILKKAKDGDIIILHDVYGTTVEACKTVIPQLIDKGFQLVTVSELLEARAIQREAGQIIKSAPPQQPTASE